MNRIILKNKQKTFVLSCFQIFILFVTIQSCSRKNMYYSNDRVYLELNNKDSTYSLIFNYELSNAVAAFSSLGHTYNSTGKYYATSEGIVLKNQFSVPNDINHIYKLEYSFDSTLPNDVVQVCINDSLVMGKHIIFERFYFLIDERIAKLYFYGQTCDSRIIDIKIDSILPLYLLDSVLHNRILIPNYANKVRLEYNIPIIDSKSIYHFYDSFLLINFKNKFLIKEIDGNSFTKYCEYTEFDFKEPFHNSDSILIEKKAPRIR